MWGGPTSATLILWADRQTHGDEAGGLTHKAASLLGVYSEV